MTRACLLIALLAALAILAPGRASAQTDPMLSQYYQAPTFYNPAEAGQTDYLRIRAGSRMQWVGVDGAPTTFAGLADMPFKLMDRRLGVGVKVMTEKIGLYNSMDIAAQLAYKFRRWGGMWSAGLSVGMYDQKFKGSEVILPSDDDYHQGTDDAIPTQDIHGMALDLGAGVSYTHRLFSAGLSMTHLTSPTIRMKIDGSETSTEKEFQWQARRTLYFTAQSNIPIKNTLFEVIPSVMVKSDLHTVVAEATGRVRYNKFLSAGVGYRYNDAVYATVAAEFKGFFIGYAYDYPLTAIAKASSGSHEIVAGYSLKLDFSEKNKNKHKSIRIM